MLRVAAGVGVVVEGGRLDVRVNIGTMTPLLKLNVAALVNVEVLVEDIVVSRIVYSDSTQPPKLQ